MNKLLLVLTLTTVPAWLLAFDSALLSVSRRRGKGAFSTPLTVRSRTSMIG